MKLYETCRRKRRCEARCSQRALHPPPGHHRRSPTTARSSRSAIAIEVAIHPFQAFVVDVGLRIAVELIESGPRTDDATRPVEAGAGVVQSRVRNIRRCFGQFLELAEQARNTRHLELNDTGRSGIGRRRTRHRLLAIKVAPSVVSKSRELNEFGSHTQAPSMGMKMKKSVVQITPCAAYLPCADKAPFPARDPNLVTAVS